MDFKSKIILISGPTASGKSNFAIKLAKKINGEIINADSMQVYKELKILSARPEPKNYQNIKHHLYGFHNVKKNFSTGDWLKLVVKKIEDLKKIKKTPILVGGTGLYFKSLLNGLVNIPNIPIRSRNKIRSLHKDLGQKNFYKKLLKLDPKVEGKILLTDSQRVQRAYEVKLKTKKSLFDWIANTKSDFLDFDLKRVFIDIPRTELLQKISIRTDLMFKENCIAEVKKFNLLKINKSLSANKLIGVQEINRYLNGAISIAECKELINIKTRQYSKRQNTWARGHMKNWIKLYSKNFSILSKKTLKAVS